MCGAPVERDQDGAHIRCTGAECPAQLLRNLAHFASRDAMDIDGLGIAVVENLVGAGLVKTPGDLYFLQEEDVAKLDRMGKKSAQNLIQAIERSKSQDLSRLIYAFGIRQVGQKAGKVLAAHFKTLDALEQALWARRPSGTIHHSDKGSQYVSLAYMERLKEAKLLASTGSTGDSYDNAMAESINGLYKAEVIHRKSWKNRAEVELATLTWVDWYNNR